MADYLDTRDLADRLTELETSEEPLDESEQEELDELTELSNQVGEWEDGTMIPEADFQDYAQELANDCDMIPDGLNWPLTCIDWEWAAKELAYDYSLVTYQGTDYYVRSC